MSSGPRTRCITLPGRDRDGGARAPSVERIARRTGPLRDDARGARRSEFAGERIDPGHRVRRQVDRARALGGRVDRQHEFAALAVRVGGEPGVGLAEPHRGDLLERLGQLARDDEIAFAAERRDERTHGVAHAVRRLVDDQREREGRHRGEKRVARLRLRRQEAEEGEARRHEAGGGHRRDQRRGAGHRDHRVACVAHGAHETRAGIGHRGRPRR